VVSSQLIVERAEPDVAVVCVKGEHDLDTAPSLREQLGALQAESCSVILDLSEATFIDSSILAAIVDGHRRASDDSLAFVVSLGLAGSPAVRRILDVTGLNEVLVIRGDREAALAAARGAAA
jgi:anti-sigma B factor antagonist